MPLISRPEGRIALYGATGYAGRLVAAELAGAGADFVLSGRNREKLNALARELGCDARVRSAQLEDPGSLRSLLSDCSAVIDCAGPFELYGEPVLRAAIETSTHYLDISGEQRYMRMAFERYGPAAAEAGVAVIPAMGFGYAAGDMIAALTAEGMGEVDEVIIATAWDGLTPTLGTILTTLDILGDDAVEWRELQWLPAERPWGRARFGFPEPIGRRLMVSWSSGEHITVPRHVPTRRLRTLVTASTFAPHPVPARLFQLLARPTALAMRTRLNRVARAAISRMPEGPGPKERVAARYTIVCEMVCREQTRRGILRGRDNYGLSAALITRGALIAAGEGFAPAGALAPSQAFEPRPFLKGLDRYEIEWKVERTERPAPGQG